MVTAQGLLAEIVLKSIPNDPSGLAKDVWNQIGNDEPIDVTDIENDIRELLDLFAKDHNARAVGRASVHYRRDYLQALMTLSTFILVKGKKASAGAP